MASDLSEAAVEIEPIPASTRRSRRTPTRTPIAGVLVGRLAAADDPTRPMVDFPANPIGRPMQARCTVAISSTDPGREAVLMFEEGDLYRPIVIGLLQTRAPASPPAQAEIDGQIVNLEAEQQVVLRCGKASITLTRAGKVLIRGTYVLSRSSGANRIKGGSVQIN